jgi:hypothetical protein
MIPEYTLVCVPLGSTPADRSKTRFPVFLVCQPGFPAGEISAGDIAAAIAAHPLLSRSSDIAVKALVRPFASWEQDKAMTQGNSRRVTLRYRGRKSFEEMRASLGEYLGGAAKRTVAGIRPDVTFDNLGSDHFLNVAKLHDDLNSATRAMLAGASGMGLLEASLEQLSVPAVQALNAAARAALIQALVLPPQSGVFASLVEAGVDHGLLLNLSAGMKKIQRRLTPSQPPSFTTPFSDGNALMHDGAALKEVQHNDPNLAVHAAMKNALLARTCGFVTEWECESDEPMEGDLVFQIDLTDLPSVPAAASLSTAPTALRRGSHTHPLAFADLNATATGNSGLAALNSAGGPRYLATAVNAESGIIKNLLVQAGNSLSNTASGANQVAPDADQRDAPPVLLRDRQFGPAEPETTGVTFSAPVEDLTPRNGSPSVPQRRATYPCLFLDDLWIGYRLDISEGISQHFCSVHEQEQRIQFATGGEAHGPTEDFYEREQADDREFSSTEFATYLGMSHAQMKDYRLFIKGDLKDDDGEEIPPLPGTPFTTTVTAYSNATRLLFGKIFSYRLRNVFLGGVSLTPSDPQLLQMGAMHYQRFPFFRARAYRPGELISNQKGEQDGSKKDVSTFYISDRNPSVGVTLVPSPIDAETSRFHGMLLARDTEPKRHADRHYVNDIGKFFSRFGRNAKYFPDPDVNGIIIRATLLNGSPDRSDANFAMEDGTYCEIVKHLALPAFTQAYGRPGEWEGFRPIVLEFKNTDALRPAIERKGILRDCHEIEILVPRGTTMEISILPDVDAQQLKQTAVFVSSSSELHDIEVKGVAAGAGRMPVPAIAEVRFQVVHALALPSRRPHLISVPALASVSAFAKAIREVDSAEAELSAYIELDAATTGQIGLETTWYDIDDRPELDSFALTSGSSSTITHSVVFEARPPAHERPLAFIQMLAARKTMVKQVGARSFSFAEQFSLQRAENKVFLSDPSMAHAGRLPDAPWHRLKFKDGRRKIASVRATANSRFAAVLGTDGSVLHSDRMLIDVPSTISMSSPKISHVLPISRRIQTQQGELHSDAKEMAIRIFVARPSFESGPGERVAIGCRTGDEPAGRQASLDKLVTQWGEDPTERPGLILTTRSPRASDFTIPDSQGDRPTLDENLYPRTGGDADAAVIYRDDLAVLPPAQESRTRRLSVASFALQRAPDQGLWFFDVAIRGEFIGWCGLALYRHQPHACEGRELSRNAEWVYAAFVNGDPMTYIERSGNLHLTVGPVYDEYTTFELDTTEFRHGVSENLARNTERPVILQRYQRGGAYYFETVVRAHKTTWNLTKRRFGHSVASTRINDEKG